MAVHYHMGRFPPENLDWMQLIPLLGPTAAAVARYDGALATIQNPRLFLTPLGTQEAVLSSRIEGTQATMGEVLEFEAGQKPVSPTRHEDILEIINYRAAMQKAEEMLNGSPLSQHVVREAHRVLLSSSRGKWNTPGEYRRVANWIGPPGRSIKEAKFVPIEADRLPDAMDAWERYINEPAQDRLVQLAILHAEFEALHPFLDGNGRLGRLLIPLFLWRHHYIRQPTLYISAYFEAHREAYYEGLLSVSRDDNWTGWCRFFLEAIRQQAEDNLSRVQGIAELYDRMKYQIADLTRSRYATRTLELIFARPIFGGTEFMDKTGCSWTTARRILNTLCENRILQRVVHGAGRRTAVFVFPELLNTVEGDNSS